MTADGGRWRTMTDDGAGWNGLDEEKPDIIPADLEPLIACWQAAVTLCAPRERGRGPIMSDRYQITLYGYPDNDPPNSDAIAYPRSDGYKTLHDRAAGTGDWKDPITFAAGNRFRTRHPVGTRIYV